MNKLLYTQTHFVYFFCKIFISPNKKCMKILLNYIKKTLKNRKRALCSVYIIEKNCFVLFSNLLVV